MAKILKPQYKDIVNLFEKLTGSRSMWQVYQDSLEMIALSIQNSVEMYPERYDYFENKFKNISKKYSDNENKIISEIYAEITELLEKNPFQDLLGDLYMQLDMGSAALGQFFTPFHISSAMAQCVFDETEIKRIISENGFITVNEPCVGGGANIIGWIECCKKSGINYQKDVIIVGQDLSQMSATMGYIALSLLGCQCVIKNDDTLNRPFTKFKNEVKNHNILYSPVFVMNGGYLKL